MQVALHTTSPAAIERAAEAFRDAALGAHLAANDAAEEFEDAARRAVNDEHIAAACDELLLELKTRIGNWAPTTREAAMLDMFEMIDERATKLAGEEL